MKNQIERHFVPCVLDLRLELNRSNINRHSREKQSIKFTDGLDKVRVAKTQHTAHKYQSHRNSSSQGHMNPRTLVFKSARKMSTWIVKLKCESGKSSVRHEFQVSSGANYKSFLTKNLKVWNEIILQPRLWACKNLEDHVLEGNFGSIVKDCLPSQG
ncbi:uncharacterized protein LOC103516069 [Diaphorina citri]|uniref:Uncharacterized protein LOC103516069 n=1 Tax=Diaphorina citri TaxID=121845 RepID=A0A1S3DCR5_DIACI|nr:uncharacterized protein LOC103516069 [Diaphorina citri]